MFVSTHFCFTHEANVSKQTCFALRENVVCVFSMRCACAERYLSGSGVSDNDDDDDDDDDDSDDNSDDDDERSQDLSLEIDDLVKGLIPGKPMAVENKKS